MPARSDRSRRTFARLTHVAFVLLLARGAVAAEERPSPPSAPMPNIVLVIGDDHGWPYFGFMGDEIVKTPRLDGLAREGIVFPFGYTSASTRKPSLRSLLTGLHPLQWRARREALRRAGLDRAEMDPIRDFATLPGLLQQRDFVSFQGGTYFEGRFDGGGFTHGTKRLRAVEAEDTDAQMQASAGGAGFALGRSTMEPLFEFLEAHVDRPFFVWFAPKLPHAPNDPPEDLLALYSEVMLSDSARRYYANITRFDRVLGELLDKLAALDLREKTLVLYLSDNGWEQEPHETATVKQLGGPKGKSSMYELGFRTPIIVSWPGRIAGGRRNDALLSHVDVFTTLLDLAGLDAPPDRTGVSFAPLLFGESDPPRESLIGGMLQLRPPAAVEAARANPASGLVRDERAYFLRNPEWHYIWYARHERYPDRPRDVLFRIDSDPFETTDVAAANPGLIARFREEIRRWRREVTTRTRAAVEAEAERRSRSEASATDRSPPTAGAGPPSGATQPEAPGVPGAPVEPDGTRAPVVDPAQSGAVPELR